MFHLLSQQWTDKKCGLLQTQPTQCCRWYLFYFSLRKFYLWLLSAFNNNVVYLFLPYILIAFYYVFMAFWGKTMYYLCTVTIWSVCCWLYDLTWWQTSLSTGIVRYISFNLIVQYQTVSEYHYQEVSRHNCVYFLWLYSCFLWGFFQF